MVAGWVGGIRKLVEGVILEKDQKLEELLAKYRRSEEEIREKVDAKYKEVIPKPGRLPPNVFQAFLKKLQTNSESELNRLLSEMKEKQKVENSELLKSHMAKIRNSEQQITEVAAKAKDILRKCDALPKQTNGAFLNSNADSSPRGRHAGQGKSKQSPRCTSPSIPKIESSADILKSLNLKIYDEKLIMELENAATSARV